MAVRKICRPKGCRGSPRCDHPWWFDVMWQGKRWRMRVDEFARSLEVPPSRSPRSRRRNASGNRSSLLRSWREWIHA